VEVLEVLQASKKKIIDTAFNGKNNVAEDINCKIFSLSCRMNGENQDINEFQEPADVKVSLKDLTLSQDDISQLCAIGFSEQDGKFVPFKLGGIYNPNDKSFTFYTQKYNYYTVMKAKNLININLKINNRLGMVNAKTVAIDVPPMIVNGRTLVPLRFIGEALGAQFTWDPASKTVTYYLNGQEIKLVIDVPAPGMDTPPTIIHGRTMVPARYISEIYGARVMWIPYEKLVTIVK
jgi:hypothetical protein